MVGVQTDARRKHEQVKRDARKFWRRIDYPTDDFPDNPEHGFADDAIEMKEQDPQCAPESDACGSNRTRREIRNSERSEKKYGNVIAEAERLLEYPRATKRDTEIMKEMRMISAPR